MNAKRLQNIFLVVAGTFILAISIEYFILPYHILSGGVAGIAVALGPFFHIDETLFANIGVLSLLGIGWLVLGNAFAMQTLLSSLCYPVFTTFLAAHPVDIQVDPILASFYAGLIGGIGIGMVMRTGASTGGMDIPPLILHKLTGIKISTLVMTTDALTVLLGIAAFGLDAALVGLISVFASGYGINRVLSLGQAESKSVQIISDRWQEIQKEIQAELDRGVTLIDAQGGYTGAPKKIILCVVSARQYNKLLDLVRIMDEKAFDITTDASDMHGEGFTYSSPNI